MALKCHTHLSPQFVIITKFMPLIRRILFYSACIVGSLSDGAEIHPISTVEGLNRLFETPCHQAATFSLTGTVTYIIHSAASLEFILQDKTGTAALFNATNSIPSAGTYVRVQGSVPPSSSLETWMDDLSITPLAAGSPPKPQCISLDQLGKSKFDILIRTTASVIDVFADELSQAHDFLLLKSGTTILSAIIARRPENHALLDAEIELTGLFRHHIPGIRKFVVPCIYIGRDDIVTVIKQPPADPFNFPALPNVIYISPNEVAQLGKRTIRGTVLATWKPNGILIMTDDGRKVLLQVCEGETLPHCGDKITAVGYPQTDLYHINLTRSRLRIDQRGEPTGSRPIPCSPETLLSLSSNDRMCFFGESLGRLLTLRGIVRSLPASASENQIMTLDCGCFNLLVDYSTHPSAADGIAIGSELEVTGRCIPDVDAWQNELTFPRIKGITLVPRQSSDIKILRGPSPLTPARLSAIIGVLIALLLAFLTRNRILKRIGQIKLSDRTRLAVELHDSLSQALTGLACHITAAEKAPDLASTRSKLATVTRMLQSCRTELRNCLFDLRTDLFSETTLGKAIRRALEPFVDQAELLIRFNVKSALCDDATIHAVVATVRELTANAIRHGHAWTVRIAGTVHQGNLYFSVTDDGCGFDFTSRLDSKDGHFGLDGIQERIDRLNGSFKLVTPRRGGTKVKIHVPLRSKP